MKHGFVANLQKRAQILVDKARSGRKSDDFHRGLGAFRDFGLHLLEDHYFFWKKKEEIVKSRKKVEKLTLLRCWKYSAERRFDALPFQF